VKGVKIVTLFSYIVWPTAMKFGKMTGSQGILVNFDPLFHGAQIFDSGYIGTLFVAG